MSNHDELYRDFKTVMHGGVEVPLSHKPRLRDLPPITAAEIAAYTPPAEPLKPRPAVTGWEGADMDAYWLDGDTWRHCQTGASWAPDLNDVAAHVCASISAKSQGASRSRADAALTTSIADYLAVENREDVCRAHVIQAEEIIAMVRESDRDMRNGGL